MLAEGLRLLPGEAARRLLREPPVGSEGRSSRTHRLKNSATVLHTGAQESLRGRSILTSNITDEKRSTYGAVPSKSKSLLL